MITQELIDFIKHHAAVGTSREQVAQTLIANGWAVVDVEDAFRAVAPLYTSVAAAPVAAPIITAAQPAAYTASPMTASVDAGPIVATYQQPVVAKKKGWLAPVIITLVVLAGLGVGAYYGSQYYMQRMAPKSAEVIGYAFANLAEADTFSFSGTTSSRVVDADLNTLASLGADLQSGSPTAAATLAALPKKDEVVMISGSISRPDGSYAVEIKDASNTVNMQMRRVAGADYMFSGGTSGMPLGSDWIKTDSDDVKFPLPFMNDIGADDRARAVAAMRAGTFFTIEQEFAKEGNLAHYAASVRPEAASMVSGSLAEELGKASGSTFQVWIDTATRTVTRITGEDKSGGTTDLSFTNVNQPVTIEAPANARTMEEMMGVMMSAIDGDKAAQASLGPDMQAAFAQAEVRAGAAKARSLVSSMAAQAELYYMNEGSGTYGTINTTVGACAGTGAGSMFTSAKGLKALVAELIPLASEYRCQSTSTAWAVVAKAKAQGESYFCADSSGYIGSVTSLNAGDDAKCK